MIRNLKNIIDTGLTVEEMETLAKADEILHRIQNDLDSHLCMICIETGEVISTNEFARTRGILGGIAKFRAWQISINRWGD